MGNLIDIVREALELPNAEIKNLGLSGGMTNLNYLFSVDGEWYIVRVPGNGTEDFINRVEEMGNLELASSLGINPKLRYFNVKTGLKVTEKINDARTVTKEIAKGEEIMKSVAATFRTLHYSGKTMKNNFKLFELMAIYEDLGIRAGAQLFEGFEKLKEDIQVMKKNYEKLVIENVPCHIDATCANFILNEDDKMYLIDWEYSGMFDPMWDIASYSIEAELSKSEEDLFINYYINREATSLEKERILLHKIFQDFLWSLWTLFKEEKGDDFGAYGKKRFNRAKESINVYKNTY